MTTRFYCDVDNPAVPDQGLGAVMLGMYVERTLRHQPADFLARVRKDGGAPAVREAVARANLMAWCPTCERPPSSTLDIYPPLCGTCRTRCELLNVEDARTGRPAWLRHRLTKRIEAFT